MEKIFFWASVCLLLLFSFQNGSGAVMIAEVGNDPTWGGDPFGEYIVICNTGPAIVDIQNYRFTDNSNTFVTITTNSTVLIPGGCYLMIQGDSSVFGPSNYNCTNIPANSVSGTWTNNLSNSSDRVLLFDNTSTEIDAISYGGDIYAFSPSLADNANNQGIVYRRNGYPNVLSMVDTNSASDWSLVDLVMGNQANYGDSISPCGVPVAPPTAANGTLSGNVFSSSNRGINKALITLQNLETGAIRSTFSNNFGKFQFSAVPLGNVYLISVQAKGRTFITNNQLVQFFNTAENFNFISTD